MMISQVRVARAGMNRECAWVSMARVRGTLRRHAIRSVRAHVQGALVRHSFACCRPGDVIVQVALDICGM